MSTNDLTKLDRFYDKMYYAWRIAGVGLIVAAVASLLFAVALNMVLGLIFWGMAPFGQTLFITLFILLAPLTIRAQARIYL